MQDHDLIGIKDSMFKLWKILKIYEDFEKFFYEIWVNIFHNYTTSLVILFSKKALKL